MGNPAVKSTNQDIPTYYCLSLVCLQLALWYILYTHRNMTIGGSCFYAYDKNHSKDFFAAYRPYRPSLQVKDDPTSTARLNPYKKKTLY